MQASKKNMLALSMASLISSVLFAILAILMLIENSPFNIIVNPVGGIEVCILAVFVHCLLNFMLVSMYAPDGIENKFHFQMMTLVKCSGQLILACIIFHTIAVCFGAPVLTSTSKTFHFAMLLSASFCLPCCLFLGPNIDNWIDVFLTKSHTSMETVVYFSGIGALVGSWLGAIPIPLDWDRPWQEWPISCVIGALGGYSIGLLLSAVQIPRNYRKLHKSKFF